MIIDLSKGEGFSRVAEHHDVCVAGGGVAGIVLAKRLAEAGRRVLLLEGGGSEFSEESQELYKGEITGREYYALETARLRFLGGTSNHWGGQSRPLAASDFAQNDDIPDSGWPLAFSEVDAYRRDACALLDIEDFPAPRRVGSSNGELQEIVFRTNPIRAAERFREFLRSNNAITLCLNANLTAIQVDATSGRITAFTFKGYDPEQLPHTACADQYVLALGGIENARVLLLLATEARQLRDSAVGRFFMEHPSHTVALYLADRSPFGPQRKNFALTDLARQSYRVAGATISVEPLESDKIESFMDSAKYNLKALACLSEDVADFLRHYQRFNCPGVGYIGVMSEQVPNFQSQIELSDDRDRFGLRKAQLNWRLTTLDKKTIRSASLSVGSYFANADVGRVRIMDWVLSGGKEVLPGLDDDMVAGFHHMGGTRMGPSDRDGVVDSDCRVFGFPNLYVGGSSVFRTGGHVNPTFTIVQLALRLADHLVLRSRNG